MSTLNNPSHRAPSGTAMSSLHKSNPAYAPVWVRQTPECVSKREKTLERMRQREIKSSEDKKAVNPNQHTDTNTLKRSKTHSMWAHDPDITLVFVCMFKHFHFL